MPTRSYGQHCAVAKSLDVVGDRWTLLVVRDLLDGPRRYGDLLAALAPIATDVLAGRLRHLEAHGLVVKQALPGSGSSYALTADGRALEDVLHAHARWGRRLVVHRDPGTVARPEWLARALRAHLRADRAGPPLTLRLDTPEGSVTLRIAPDGVETVPDGMTADVTLSGQSDTLYAATDPDRVSDLVASGRLRIDGAADAVSRLRALFVPAPAGLP
ncbi:winged helix-turn-helix transcriptional regulator [Mycolicibacterium grossiae]|uniref:HxlR family transcriptional regulator n=1 Tax=Mycolicibacterium grossiae TaxID=1552759 RepID=A0A1E8Q5P1_9MYCO|nr:winged helix-turn-helix transcriptional regulator [Mycolicibacterium grossiae]OFJ53883.1 HxlR family transcriptional regulator [Mycolicibacterium grossiae]QEM47690.1 helix-turn-helix transcriptional regulator [Mycolicibacterium grossiae]